MTIQEIIQQVSSVAGTYSPLLFHRDRVRLKIKPTGKLRTRPQHYPATTPALILSARGFQTALMPLTPTARQAQTALVTVASLKRTSRKARGAK